MIDLVSLENEISDKLGREVDLTTARGVRNSAFKNEILQEMKLLYTKYPCKFT